MMKIPLLDLTAQYRTIQAEIDMAIHQVLESGKFILSSNVRALEDEIAAYLGARHAVGVASGTDALVIALRALGITPGDEVILPAFTFFATAGAILSVGAVPVYVDILYNTFCLDINQIAKRITSRTKAIIPVHLFGHPAEMNAIVDLARAYDLKIVEDNAQAFGASYSGKKTGCFGDIACLSFFPSKNLGGYGDGGMVVTSDSELADKVRMLRTHGWHKKYYPEILGYNSRLDEIQAAILRVKLRYVDQWNQRRREIAEAYTDHLVDLGIGLPGEAPNAKHVYHLFVIRLENRDFVQKVLERAEIASDVYYPQPLHLSEPCRGLGYKEGDFPVSEAACRETLAIPLFPEMSQAQFETVISELRQAIRGGEAQM
jgi:dTDP-4-amino-4,6-dideoxygalactose transaminase